MGRLWQFAMATAIVCSGQLLLAADTAGTPIGKQIAAFSLPDFHGKSHSLDTFKDQPVVVVFFGTECPLAKSYGPRLKELADEFGKQGVAFLGIDANQQDSLTEIGAYARAYGIEFPMLKDNNNEVADAFGAIRTPEVFLLDKDRVVRYWGRIDDQYGFKTGAGYVEAEADPAQSGRRRHRSVGRQASDQPGGEGRRLLYWPSHEDHAARRGDLCEASRSHHARSLRRVPSQRRSRPVHLGHL